MTYREEIDKLNQMYQSDFSLGMRVFVCYCKEKNLEIPTKGFFDKGGLFDRFLNEDADKSILDKGLERYIDSTVNTQVALALIEKGEEMIREGYRIKDDNSMIATHDVVGEREREHIVSLMGIHDKDYQSRSGSSLN